MSIVHQKKDIKNNNKNFNRIYNGIKYYKDKYNNYFENNNSENNENNKNKSGKISKNKPDKLDILVNLIFKLQNDSERLNLIYDLIY